MKTHEREILIYYNPESRSDRQTVAFAKSVSGHVRTFAYGKTPSTETSWSSILSALQVEDPKRLLNKSHPYYQSEIRGREFNVEDWAKILKRNPDLMKSPIAIRGRKAVLCSTPTDIYRLM